jgi:redox-sensitive bicupin YhaK (pirin superfamily)
VIEVRRAADRLRTEREGIVSRHSFSAGAHYDPDNIAFGPVIGVDEHRLAGGAGFERHAHTGVIIISWVLDGILLHQDAAGSRTIGPGETLRQDASHGIEHAERNASDAEPLRFVQTTLLSSGPKPGFAVVRRAARERLPVVPLMHLYVARGAFSISGREVTEGDSARIRSQVVTATGNGELLMVTFEP